MGRRLQVKAWANDFDVESDGGGACRPRPANSGPRQHPAGSGERTGAATQVAGGIQGSADPRPRRGRLRRHVRADHCLRPAGGADQPAVRRADGGRCRVAGATDEPVSHRTVPNVPEGGRSQGRDGLRRTRGQQCRRTPAQCGHGAGARRLRRSQSSGRPGRSLLRALPKGVRREEADAAGCVLHAASGGLIHRSLRGRTATHRVRPSRWLRRYDHLGRDGRALRRPGNPPGCSPRPGLRPDPRSRYRHWHLLGGGDRPHPQDNDREVARP